VHVGHHRPNVAQRVGALQGLDRVDVLPGGLVPLGGIPLVDRVDLALGGDVDVRVGEDELAKGGIQGPPVDLALGGDHENG